MDRTTLMTRWILCLLFLAVLGGGSADETKASAALQSLGRIVYLPNLSSQDVHVSAPFIFDAENLLDISKKEDIGRTDQNSMYFDNSGQLVRQLARERGIDESLKEECFSVQAEFKSLAGPERDVNAAQVHAMRFHCKTYIQKDHRLNDFPLKSDFKNDFNKLPVTVKNAHEDRAWQPFRDFMNKWGSHIVETAYTGAAYQSWSSARRSNNYKQSQLEARACAKAEGRSGHALQEPCRRYNEHDRDEASKLNAFDTKRVRGGTRETRRKLEREMVTKELIEKFLKEEDVDEQSVHFEYMPVWDFLLQRCPRDSDDAKRALGLQAYYEGWMAHGCPLVTTTGQQNNNAQMMVPEYTKDKKPTGSYLCIRRCQGCHDYNNDCHLEVGQACCRAYGPSALRRVHEDFVVRAHDYNSGWCDANNGCKYAVGSGCHCEKSNEEEGCNYRFPLNPNDESLKYKVIWDQKDSHRPKDFESLLAMEK